MTIHDDDEKFEEKAGAHRSRIEKRT